MGEHTTATKCDIKVIAKWDDGGKVEYEIPNISPEVMAEMIPWLRDRQINNKEPSSE